MHTETIIKELDFKAIRSSGAGGQHVNKTASKVVLSFNVLNSEGLTASEKQRLQQRLQNRITSEGIISLQCSESRSQHRNKAIVIERLIVLLKQHLRKAKVRKKTKPSKNSIERRLRSKKVTALKKSNRKPPKLDR
ncbi:alternative ribosome rescue aminoacyl-tRNA hydrolase ArfB [Cochleicola gelatinilyticus]|uniref:Peptide chain release factor 1 n=1 Tax=Cochleicola gelatinilyticus TaxID=1763537 RepID=A0A167ITE0_9FLAO|nr:alternative ribosome rescue aminoacyl-tRNA hydrolase ArfB [Cochleicola gelatinilyticus]OAB79999.1 peptide chain release factor 1 [Cochleicola gelatinilyticus]